MGGFYFGHSILGLLLIYVLRLISLRIALSHAHMYLFKVGVGLLELNVCYICCVVISFIWWFVNLTGANKVEMACWKQLGGSLKLLLTLLSNKIGN